MHHFIDLEEEVALPNGVTLAKSTIGEIVAIDADGKRMALDCNDAILWFWYSTLGRFPEPPRIPHDSTAAERARQAQAAIEARKVRNFTVTKDAEGNVIVTLDDGTVATIPTTN